MANKYLEKIAAKQKKDHVPLSDRAEIAIGSAIASPLLFDSPKPVLMRKFESMENATSSEHLNSYRTKKDLWHIPTKHVHSARESGYVPPEYAKKHKSIETIFHHDSDTGLHEFGHAHSYTKFKNSKIHRIRQATQRFSRSGLVGGGAGLLGASMAVSNNKRVRDAAPYTTAAIAAPTLIEEARASLSPYKHLRETVGKDVANKFLKRMAPAYGTYALTAAGAVGSAVLAKSLYNHVNKKKT